MVYLITVNINWLQILMILDTVWHCLITNNVYHVRIQNKVTSELVGLDDGERNGSTHVKNIHQKSWGSLVVF
jgi:hypothetical protein